MRSESPDPTGELVERASEGDGIALEVLLIRFLPGLDAYLRRNADRAILARESGRDLTQSVCRELLERLADGRFEYRGEAQFKQWLYRAAMMKLLNRHRFQRAERREIQPEVLETDLPQDSSQASPSRELERQEEFELLRHCFARLPERYKQVLRLSRIEGLDHAGVAERLGITPANSRMLLSRALSRLASYGRATLDLDPARQSRPDD